MRPSQCIVPILGFDKIRNKKEFLGTGFFCGDPCYLATAYHVIKDWKDSLYIAIRDMSPKFHEATIITQKSEADIALMKVDSYVPPLSFPLAKDNEIVPNKIIYSFEYGTTRTIGKKIYPSPATRMGNVTRILNLTELYGLAGESILELSFPALHGSSGSPIIDTGANYSIWGIIKANIAYELLPAQIERALNDNGKIIEEIKYILPQALAINVRHLSQMIKEVNK